MDAWTLRTWDALEAAHGQEMGLVELVVACCELSEDETEVADHVDRLISSRRVVVRHV